MGENDAFDAPCGSVTATVGSAMISSDRGRPGIPSIIQRKLRNWYSEVCSGRKLRASC
jgi:hypothetical protein